MNEPVVIETKKAYLSKTVWLNALIALAGILAGFGVIPGLKIFVESNPELILGIIGALGIGLRFITKGKVELK